MNHSEKIKNLLDENAGILTTSLVRENDIPTVYLTRLDVYKRQVITSGGMESAREYLALRLSARTVRIVAGQSWKRRKL